MERVSFCYSLNNIPIPSKYVNLKNMIFKLKIFIKRIRWKAFFYKKLEITPESIVDSFGFKSVRAPPKNEHLNSFESDLSDMVHNVEFKRVSSEFQGNLSKDIKLINEDPLLFFPADKTNNLYKLSKDNYNKLLTDNITKSYKKTNSAAINNVNKEVKCIAERLHLDDRVEQFNQRESFITLKDHKENFQNNPKCRLLNPVKSEIGIISKHYIEKINSNIRKTTNMNQWQNMQAVPLDGTHLVAVRGLTTKRYSTQECQREELVGASLLRPIRTNRSSLACRCQFPDSR